MKNAAFPRFSGPLFVTSLLVTLFAGCGPDEAFQAEGVPSVESAVHASFVSPDDRIYATMVWDEERSQGILFGGRTVLGSFNDVWVLKWEDIKWVWTQVETAGALPPRRYGHSAVWDGANRRMIVYGGLPASSSSFRLGDVWILSEVAGTWTWSMVEPSGTAPAARDLHSAIWDSEGSRMVVFGGRTTSYATPSSELWILTDSGTGWSWEMVTASATWPHARYDHSAVWDPAAKRMILYAGCSGSTQVYSDVWLLSEDSGGWAWTTVTPEGTAPSKRAGHSAVWDASGNRMIVFGGGDGYSGKTNDTWILGYSGSTWTWTFVSASGTPAPVRRAHMACWDQANRRMIVSGGDIYGTPLDYDLVCCLTDTAFGWSWAAENTESMLPEARHGHSSVWDSAGKRMIVFGGQNSEDMALDDVWVYSDVGTGREWRQVFPSGTVPPARYQHTAVWDEAGRRMIVYGGYNGVSYMADIWVLSETPSGWQWNEVSPTGTAPGPMYGHSAVWDSAGGRMIIFGGATTSYMNKVWILTISGDSWAWSQPAVGGSAPGVRYGHSAVWDPAGQRMIVAGGRGANLSACGDMWELKWNGTSWAWTKSWTFSINWGHVAVWDPEISAMVVHGGGKESGFNESAEVTLVTWNGTKITTTSILAASAGPDPVMEHTAVWDDSRREMVIFGGKSSSRYRNHVWALKDITLSGEYAWWDHVTSLGHFPGWRSGHSAVWDPEGRRMIVFGGLGGSYGNETWILAEQGTSVRWKYVPVKGAAPSRRSGHTAVWVADQKTMLVFGGKSSSTTALGDLWALKDHGDYWTWTKLSPEGTLPTVRSGHSAVWSDSMMAMIVFGGDSGTVLNAETWFLKWNGLSWAWSQTTIWGGVPGARSHHAAVWDEAGSRMIIFGGASSSIGAKDAAVLSYVDGSWSWTMLSLSGDIPIAYNSYSAVWDDSAARMILYAGRVDNGMSGQVTYLDPDTGVWSNATMPGISPIARYEHTAVWDGAQRRMILFGGIPGEYRDADILAFLVPYVTDMRWSLTGPVCETEPPVPVVSAPNDGEVVDSCDSVFSWTADGDMTGYDFLVYLNGEFSGLTTKSSFVIPEGTILKTLDNTWEVVSAGCPGYAQHSGTRRVSFDTTGLSCGFASMADSALYADRVDVFGRVTSSLDCLADHVEYNVNDGQWSQAYALSFSDGWKATFVASVPGEYKVGCRVIGAEGEVLAEEYVTAAVNECNKLTTCDPVSGRCSEVYNEGGTCDADSSGCTADTCVAGSCVQGAMPDCSSLDDVCSVGVCQSTGATTWSCLKNTALRDGTACALDSDGCTVDKCAAGTCKAGTQADCSAFADQCNTGVCHSTGTVTYECVSDPQPRAGQACDADSDGCTTDTCSAGTCVKGATRDCKDLSNPCNHRDCVSTGALTSSCIDDLVTLEGQGCDDGSLCTTGDTCLSGACTGAAKDCNDGYTCSSDTCDKATGECRHSLYNFMCSSSGTDCADGVCIAADGVDCGTIPKVDWTVCGLNKACFSGECEGVDTNDRCVTPKALEEGKPQVVTVAGQHPTGPVPTACMEGGISGPDAFFSFTGVAGAEYELTVEPSSDADVAVVVWNDCVLTGACLAGVDVEEAGGTETIGLGAQAASDGVIIEVIATSCEGDCGSSSYTITVSAKPQQGDGSPEAVEVVEDPEPAEVVEEPAVVEDVVTDVIEDAMAEVPGEDTATHPSDSIEDSSGHQPVDAGRDTVQRDMAVSDAAGDEGPGPGPANGGGCSSSGPGGSGSGVLAIFFAAVLLFLARRRVKS